MLEIGIEIGGIVYNIDFFDFYQDYVIKVIMLMENLCIGLKFIVY